MSKKKLKFKIGEKVHIDTDNKEWGRVASDGQIITLYKKNALINTKSIRAYILVPYRDIHKK